MADTKSVAELANHPAAKAAATAIQSASTHKAPVFDLIAESKAAHIGDALQLNAAAPNAKPKDAYVIETRSTTLNEKELAHYDDITHRFSQTGNGEGMKAFTDSLRRLNGEDEATRTHVSGALLAHGAKAGRNGASLMADVLVHVHGAKELEFKAVTGDAIKVVSAPITEIVQHGTLDNSGGIPKWSKEQSDYLDSRVAQAEANAKKLYPQEHKAAAQHK